MNRSSEHEASRAASLRDTTIVYDLLTLCLGRWAQFNVLADSFERAMKFSFEDFHVWSADVDHVMMIDKMIHDDE